MKHSIASWCRLGVCAVGLLSCSGVAAPSVPPAEPPPEVPVSEPAPAEAEPADPSTTMVDPTVPDGVTRVITRNADGSEHVDINVDLNVYDPEGAFYPEPFAVSDIQAAMPVDTELAFKIVSTRAENGELRWRVMGVDEENVTISYRRPRPDGSEEVLAEESFPWAQIAKHASFPKAFSRRSEGSVTVGAGTFDAYVFEVRPPKLEPPVLERFHFAKRLPGPPVLHEVYEAGKPVHRMEMIVHSGAGR